MNVYEPTTGQVSHALGHFLRHLHFCGIRNWISICSTFLQHFEHRALVVAIWCVYIRKYTYVSLADIKLMWRSVESLRVSVRTCILLSTQIGLDNNEYIISPQDLNIRHTVHKSLVVHV